MQYRAKCLEILILLYNKNYSKIYSFVMEASAGVRILLQLFGLLCRAVARALIGGGGGGGVYIHIFVLCPTNFF